MIRGTMTTGERVNWTEEADVVVVGYGGAGAVAAAVAHDAGEKVLILEKQPKDRPNETRHTPNTRMAAGAWFSPDNEANAVQYIEGMTRISNETLDGERKDLIRVFSQYLVDNTEWMKTAGVELGGPESLNPNLVKSLDVQRDVREGRHFFPDFPKLPGSDCSWLSFTKANGKYRYGASLFKSLSATIERKKIPILWESPAAHLVTESGEICGVQGRREGRAFAARARRAVILTCGGFEFNTFMKENYLRVNPAHFYGNPANTGDGINMALEMGAALWHMNNASWRVIMKFPDFPIAFSIQHHTASVIVDRRGNRFSSERFKSNAFGYELTNYDTHAMYYPRVPCYWIFDEKRRAWGPVASPYGPCNPPGGIPGESFYVWSSDNQKEIDRGWVMKANTLEELARKIAADPDNAGTMDARTLEENIKRYNDYCRKSKDIDFDKPKEYLTPVEDPPYYAVKLWPGGPNTQGGPKRNIRGQILRPDNHPIPRLYSAGELGSVWGMLYQGGGNIAECVAFGRIAGQNAVGEKRRG